MARTNNPDDTIRVATIPERNGIHTGKGKPPRVIRAAMRTAAGCFAPSVGGGGGGLGGSGAYGGIGGGSFVGSGGNFYSPELSTDFLELPQSLDEQRNYYRFFYENDPFVGQAIDQHSELPLSKIRIQIPEAKSRALAEKSQRFCNRWAKSVRLLHRLIEIVHEYVLLGEVFIFAEDTSPDMPKDITHEMYREVSADGEIVEEWRERPDADARAVKWLKKNYKGWTDIKVLPPEQVHMESFPFTKEVIVELVPDSKTKGVIEQARQGDKKAQRIVDGMAKEIVEAVEAGENITLNTDPEAGSFLYYMARKKSQYTPRGKSVLQRCLRTLVFRDKLRQAQTSIASRHMTPFRLIYAEDMNEAQVDELREQVDLALMDPDYSIITNFQVNWEEISSEQRLMDLTSEYDLTDRQMYAGLGVTESLLSGESSYSGDRINLEVINTRYMLLREVLQDYVEEYLFKPMCARMGFIEEDEDGEEMVIYPKLSFTRLALRDNSETFDALYNLYQKGSLDIDVILDLLNIDPVTTKEKLQRDLMTVQDASFNEVLRAVYSRVGDALAENSNAVNIIAERLGLKYQKKEEEGRF